MVHTRNDCVARDNADPLARMREHFDVPDDMIYLDGNSLGALPHATKDRLRQTIEDQWGLDLIKSWNKHDWYTMPLRCGQKLSKFIGAKPTEVVCADSTSVNLFKLLATALAARSDRKVIVSERSNFPTDLYIAQGLIGMLDCGHELRLIDSDAEIETAIQNDVAVVMLTHVDYRSGRVHDMKAITKKAHDAGALILWDLAHSAGALPVELNAADADLAVGCGYKYLNGGPGAPAFLYVAERLQEHVRSPLSGWMGHASPFDFDASYTPAKGIARNLCGTPPLLSMAALEASLDVMADVNILQIRNKSLELGNLFINLVESRCAAHGFRLISPRDETRGSQVSFAHPDSFPIMQALIDGHVVGDFRSPDILRFGFTPLYTRYVDVWDAVDVLAGIMDSGSWNQQQFHERGTVT
ncbi:MAG: kynureninase [Rhodospirillaceae bacterium]|nr:kynureninase [Rhodospirillaceae bacterium]